MNEFENSNYNYGQMYDDYNDAADLEMLNNSLPPKAVFNGRSFDVYERGNKIMSFPAMSGQKDYQCREYTNLPDQGPIPEGNWLIDYDTFESYPANKSFTWSEQMMNRLNGNRWKNNPKSWGNSRARIQPLDGTQTYGRNNMFVHGGYELGSAGCVDLAGNMPTFQRYLEDLGESLPLEVKYDKDCW